MKRNILSIVVVISMFMFPNLVQAKAAKISEGKKVKFHYTLKVKGEVAETSYDKEPLEYTHGTSSIVPGLEKALEGLKAGDEKNVKLTPEEGYGQRDPNLFVEMPKSRLAPGVEPIRGMIIRIPTSTNQIIPAQIIEVSDDTIVANFNHPLAGHDLEFDIKVVEVK